MKSMQQIVKSRVVSIILAIMLFASQLTNIRSVAALTIASGEAQYIKSGQLYYIKNFNSGRYLDVAEGKAEKNANVQQYTFNATAAQKWKVTYMGDGSYKITSQVGSKNLVLNVDSRNVNIYTDSGSDSQRFRIIRNSDGTYRIPSKISLYYLFVGVEKASCLKGAKVEHYDYSLKGNADWIFEPVSVYSAEAAVAYAKANYNKHPTGFPFFSQDCANFVSQCMLVGGVHFQDSWWIYKKNNTYQDGSNTSHLNTSWELADPSPWISARQFNEFWSKKVTTKVWKVSDILKDPTIIYYGQDFYKGDVVQILNPNASGKPGNAWHTMFITDYGYYDLNGDGSKEAMNEKSYVVTYHSNDTPAMNLLEFCSLGRIDKDNYLRFFTINQPKEKTPTGIVETQEMVDEKVRREGISLELTKKELDRASQAMGEKYASFLRDEDLMAYAVLNKHTNAGLPMDTVISDTKTDIKVMQEMCQLIRKGELEPGEITQLADYMARRLDRLDKNLKLKAEVVEIVEYAAPMYEEY